MDAAQKAQIEQSRNDIRKNIMAARGRKRVSFTFRGAEVEILQPLIGTILDSGDQENPTLYLLMDAIVIPGTNVRVFEVGDTETIKAWGFDKEVAELLKQVAGMSAINLEDAKKELKGNPQ